MKIFLDCEFIEGVQTYGNPILEFWLGQKQVPKPTIDLISIGLVAEDDRQYYAISKDFNLKEAWNRYDIEKDFGKPQGLGDKKVYWIRENVLKPIFLELCTKNNNEYVGFTFTYKLIKKLINRYGKTNKEIAQEVKDFCNTGAVISNNGHSKYYYREFRECVKDWIAREKDVIHYNNIPEFYGYGQNNCFVFINFLKNYL